MGQPFVGYVFLLRVPLFVSVLTAAFRWVALSSAFLHGLYDLNAGKMFWVTLAVCALWFTLCLTTDTVLRNSSERCQLRPLPAWAQKTVWKGLGLNIMLVTLLFAIGYAGAAGALLSGFFVAGQSGAGGAIAGGVATFAAVFVLLSLLYAWLEKRLPAFHSPAWIALAMRLLGSPQGFFDGAGNPRPGHKLSQNFFFAFLALYLWFGWNGWKTIERPHGDGPATFLCVIFLMTVACSLLGGLAFIFDRWRIPVLSLLTLVWLAGSGMLGGTWFERTDHIFALLPGPSGLQAPRPRDLLRPREGRVALVAASGGGIFSAGWTAKVLGELSKDIPEFSPALRLVSSVSGGSTGAMYYLNAFRDGAFDSSQSDRIFHLATQSSLDHVAWGLAYPDFLRIFFPWTPQYLDRSWALEQAWVREGGPLRDATLAQWTQEGARPAVVFNSTVVEAGERFLFSTYRPEASADPLRVRRVFWDEFTAQDVRISTAARMSAAFPYVSPAGRASTATEEHHRYHLADGGYYDNFGVVSAIEFLRSALEGGAGGPQVLLVQIEATPTWKPEELVFKQRGWGYQLIAPPGGFLSVWNATARARNAVDLSLTAQIFPNLTTVTFSYPEWNAPMSWHLTEAEIQSIVTAWNTNADVQKARQRVSSFFQKNPAGASQP